MTLGSIFVLASIVCGILMLLLAGMAVGVMFGRKSIGGSCGGLANKQNEDGTTSCGLCDSPSDACQELRSRMEQEQQV